MNDRKDLNSTEKLLGSIRRTAQRTVGRVVAEPAENTKLRPVGSDPASFPYIVSSEAGTEYAAHPSIVPSAKRTVGGKSTSAGVFIGESAIFVAVAGRAGSGRVLNQWARILMPPDLSIEGKGFSAFLKTALTSVLGKAEKLSIWTAVPSRLLKLRYLSIPDLPRAKVPNAAYWSLSKEVEINTDEEVFDFDLLGEFHEGGKKKQRLLAYAAPKAEINLLQKVFSKAGFPLTGITASPFALQNFFRAGLLPPTEQPITLACIDRDFTEITCISGEDVLLNRNIRTGGASLLEDIVAGEEEGETVVSINDLLEQEGELLDARFNLVENPAERLVGKIARTGDYCSNVYNDNQSMGTTYFFGYPDGSRKFLDFARKGMGTAVESFDPFADAALQGGVAPPKNGAERSGVIPAFGLALGDNNYTPNFLDTYQEKNVRQKFKRINFAIVLIFLVVMGACLGVFAWQQSMISGEKAQTRQLVANLDKFNPKVSQAMLTQAITQAAQQVKKKEDYAESLAPLAVVGELCAVTPHNITILSMEASFDNAPTLSPEDDKKKTGAKGSKDSGKSRRLILKGMVEADYTALDSELTQYILRLGDSPLFGDIILAGKETKKTGDQDFLKFTAEMEIL